MSRFARWVREEQPTVFYHKDGKDYIRVTAAVKPRQLSVVGGEIRKAMNEPELPEGVQLYVGGASAELLQDFADLGMIALISMLSPVFGRTESGCTSRKAPPSSSSAASPWPRRSP